MYKLKSFYGYHINSDKEIVLDLNGMEYRLENRAGTYDEIQLFRNSKCIYVLSYNTGLEYAGLTFFNAENLTFDELNSTEDEVFFQEYGTKKENLGLKKDLLEYAEINMAKILLQWLG